ncbi:MAG: PKD domain-containing protein [Bacteroidia bacterium]|nr:PKD domain-containing protein [Bacteroidia bacterium]
MKKLFTSIVFLALFAGVSFADTCNFTLNMSDTYGYGWSNSYIQIFQNGSPLGGSYSCYGATATYTISLTEGSTVQIRVVGNSSNNDYHYNLINAIGDTIASGGPNLPASPSGAVVFTFTVICPCQTNATFSVATYGMDATFTCNNTYLPSLYSIVWNFGDGTPVLTGTLNPVHTYAALGNYTATVMIIQLADPTCGDTATATVYINNCMANANFTYIQASGYTINFNSTHDYDTTLYELSWNFGDGTIINDQNDPQHVYASSGTYTVTFSVEQISDTTCHNVYTQSIVIAYCNASANFTYTNNGYTVNFNAPYSYGTTYYWNFGDGNTNTGSYLYSQTHVYTTIDTFHVSLIVTSTSNPSCTDTFATDIFVDGCLANAAFYANSNDYSVNVGTNTYFDPSLYTITWYFGDGTIVQGQDTITHLYADTGVHIICCVIHDNALSYCTDSTSQLVTVWGPCPLTSINFTWTDNNNLGFVFLTDTIYNSSEYNINWDFGDGYIQVGGTTANHTYSTAGTYIVVLTITHASIPNCVTSAENSIQAEICPANASFNYTMMNSIYYFHTITYFSTSQYSLIWEFGDSTSTSGTNSPNHTYLEPGVYYVTLTVTENSNPGCTDQQVMSVNTCNLTASFYANVDLLDVTCTTTFDPANFHIVWDFGDGSTAEDISSIMHTFSGSGTYSICMTITDLAHPTCVAHICHNIIVTVGTSEIEQPWMTIYPNPVKDNLVIDYYIPYITDINISIINQEGQVVYQKSSANAGGRHMLNISTGNISQGNYILRIENADRIILTHAFIK